MIPPIVIVAGHSGGHILPALTLMHQNHSCHKEFITTTKALDKKILNSIKHTATVHFLPLEGLPNSIKTFFTCIYDCLYTFYHAIKILRRTRPIKIISTGGLISVPVIIAGRLLSIPVDLYDLDALPSRTTRFISFFNVRILCVFEHTRQMLKNRRFCYATIHATDYPLRYTTPANQLTKDALVTIINNSLMPAEKNMSFSVKKITIAIFGGSQGSNFLTNLFLHWQKKNLDLKHSIQILHQARENTIASLKHTYQINNIPAHVFSYNPNLEQYYQLADIVITRAGAGTLFELIHFKKNTIIIPLVTQATDHQMHNAKELTNLYPNLFTTISETTIEDTAQKLNSLLNPLIRDRNIQSFQHESSYTRDTLSRNA